MTIQTNSKLIPSYSLTPDSCFSHKDGFGWQIKLNAAYGWAKGCGKVWRSPFASAREAREEAESAIKRYTEAGRIPTGLWE